MQNQPTSAPHTEAPSGVAPSSAAPSTAAPTVAPVAQSDRILLIDILRGVALLGILLMNIPTFSMPDNFIEAFTQNPDSTNFWVFTGITVLFEGKMRALFSFVFGVGVLLFLAKKEQTNRSAVRLYYRRMGWLIVFGLVHAYLLLWFGDILYGYGVCGLLLYLFRKVRPLYLALGVPLIAIVGFVGSTLFNQNIAQKHLAYLDAIRAQQTGVVLTASQTQALADWRELEKTMLPNQEDAARNTALMKGSYSSVAKRVRPLSFLFQTTYLPFLLPDVLALMLLGMALYKWGFLSGAWPTRRYRLTMLVGYGLGLPLVCFSVYYALQHTPTREAALAYNDTHPISWVSLIYPVQRILLVLAHSSAIILIVRAGLLKGLTRRLAAVGQMAFTNYIMHTLVCTLFFYGYGLNYFAELQYYQLFYLVGVIWIVQLYLSPLWLKYFRFGPLEWLWRSLTYWKWQPMQRNAPVPALPAV
ncbi:DUF418 domain-containing protein [Nibrella viscosa]|uniref:DUF418 domain-containing protein n=1 Tax=Nibrella viscosa TaxID=1084524 RepID=A0ABP8K6B9_9BACT